MHLHDIERLLADYGYLLCRTRGSHRHYRNTTSGRRITVSYHAGHGLTWRRIEEIKKDVRHCCSSAKEAG